MGRRIGQKTTAEYIDRAIGMFLSGVTGGAIAGKIADDEKTAAAAAIASAAAGAAAEKAFTKSFGRIHGMIGIVGKKIQGVTVGAVVGVRYLGTRYLYGTNLMQNSWDRIRNSSGRLFLRVPTHSNSVAYECDQT